MHTFDSNGVEIAYVDEGAGDPVLLIHGFASNVATNWIDTGWVQTLTAAGRRVIAFDNRGHGRSAKLYSTDDYGAPLMAEDARRLLDHLNIEAADIMGYSMGARISAFLAIAHPQRARSLVFAGLGFN
ncbi:MAG: alpha/beta fold hydrolase, partial [Alphaproteobacteria bacterium]